MLDKASVTANIPAADLARARAFYADKLGLTPTQEMEGIMLLYRTAAGSVFSVYQTEYAGQAGHTIAQWHVEDVDAHADDFHGRPSSRIRPPRCASPPAWRRARRPRSCAS